MAKQIDVSKKALKEIGDLYALVVDRADRIANYDLRHSTENFGERIGQSKRDFEGAFMDCAPQAEASHLDTRLE